MGVLPEKVQKERAALLVIDMQEKFRSLIVDMRTVMAGCSRLIRFCDRLGIPTLVGSLHSAKARDRLEHISRKPMLAPLSPEVLHHDVNLLRKDIVG